VCDAFPNIALFRRVHPLREFLQVRHMRIRYYRRIVECSRWTALPQPYLEGPWTAPRRPRSRLNSSVRS
jgi:hypothetical protein